MKDTIPYYYSSYLNYIIFSINIIICIIIAIECKEVNNNKNRNEIIDELLFISKDDCLHAYPKVDENENNKICFFENIVRPQINNSRKLIEDIFIQPINVNPFRNALISFYKCVKKLISSNTKINNNIDIDLGLKTGKYVEKNFCVDNNNSKGDNVKNGTIFLKSAYYYMIKKNNNKIVNIKTISYIDINTKENNHKIIAVEKDYNMDDFYMEKYVQYSIANNNKIINIRLKESKVSFNKALYYLKNIYNNLMLGLNIENILTNFRCIFISIIIIIIITKNFLPLFIIKIFNNEHLHNSIIINNKSDNKKNILTYKEICHNVNNFSITSKQEINTNNKNKEIQKIDNISLNLVINSDKNISSTYIPTTNNNFKLLPSGEEIKKELFNNIKENIQLEEDEENKSYYNIKNRKHKSLNSDILENIIKNKYYYSNKLEYLGKYMELINNKIDISKNEEKENYILKINLLNEYKIPKNDITKELISQCKYFNSAKNNNKLLPDNNIKEENKLYTDEHIIKKDIKENNNISKKSDEKEENYGGIWDVDDDDIDEDNNNVNNIDISEEKRQNLINDINSENISESSNSSYINKKEKSRSFKNKSNKKKRNKEVYTKSRLDKDFKNLEKIGEGGFGVVLKGIHRLDKGVYAIKIIKLSDVNDKENIINEAITMTSITSKHIVQYKTCWIDNELGSASKFFYDDIDSESSSTNSNNNNIIIKNNNKSKNNLIIDDEDEEEDESKDNDFSIKNYKKKDILNIKNKNDNSQENNKKNILSKYCCNYRDDSNLVTKSIISNKYNNENKLESGNVTDGKYFFILMEYCDGLTLEKFLKQNTNKILDRKNIYCFMSQILKSLVKIHSGGIIHRDIKPSNIFIKNDQLKIGDFGLATRNNNSSKLLKSKKIEGTPLYLSPEQTNFKVYNEKVDIYALGITLYEMCANFSTSMERYEDIMNLKNNKIINNKVSKNFPEESNLILSMTKSDYNERPSAKEILNSDFFLNLGKKLGI